MAERKRLVVGVSGASGAPLAVELLERLKGDPSVETHLVVTKSGMLTLRQETDLSYGEFAGLADVVYDNDDLGAALSSGSFRTVGMVVIPCSMKTVAGIVSGYSDNLLLRAADVTMKERRRLLLVARETPLSTLHLKNLYEAGLMGAVVMPPVPAYYRRPKSFQDSIRDTVDRILDELDLNPDEGRFEWKGM